MTRQRQLDCVNRQSARGGAVAVAAVARGIRSERREAQKSSSVTGSNMPPTIVVDDDDDDVHITSPRSFAQARSAVGSSRQRGRTAEGGENRASSTEDFLALRLGPANFSQSASLRIHVPGRQANSNKPRDRSGTFTIDLTAPSPVIDNDCILVNEFVQKKRKPAQRAYEPVPSEPPKELKLTCAICMDSMKEETSTICGHIFCRKCIVGAIAVQKKCPTCRQTLNSKQTHRIYIAASLKN